MRRFLAPLLLSLTVLSGCVGEEAATPAQVNPTNAQATQPASAPGQSAGAKVDRQANLVIDTLRGEAPLNVNFSLAATGVDETTVWVLDFGDDETKTGKGTDLPVKIAHRYPQAIEAAVQFEVRFADGEKIVKDATIVVTPPPAIPDVQFTFQATLKNPIPFPYQGEHTQVFNAVRSQPALNETFLVWYNVPIKAGAKELSVTTKPGGPTSLDVDLWVVDWANHFYGGTNDENAEESISVKTLAPGTYTIIINLWAGANAAITADVKVDY